MVFNWDIFNVLNSIVSSQLSEILPSSDTLEFLVDSTTTSSLV